jgi:4-hydroxybenzoate polyprenyltransferase
MKEILKISRPRFWLYELGTFQDSYSVLNIIIFALFFLGPANLLIYGINDIFDYETDKLNPKKDSYEALLSPREHKRIYYWIIATNLPFIVFAAISLPKMSLLWLFLFFFFATFYSAKPIRAKLSMT